MRLYLDDVTDYGKGYAGNVEKCVFTFSTGPEQFDFVNNWIRGNYVNEVIRSVEEHGGKVVRVTLYRDAQPTWTTNYKGEILAAMPAGSMGQARLAAIPWPAVLAFAFVAVIAYLLIRPVIQSISTLLWGPGGGTGLASIPWPLIILAVVVIGGMFMGKKRGKA